MPRPHHRPASTLLVLLALVLPASASAVTAAWSRLPADHATPSVWRYGASAVWDDDGDRALGYGGEWDYHIPMAGDLTGVSDRLSAFTVPYGIQVTEQLVDDAASSPGAPMDAAMALDEAGGRVWVFGGIAPPTAAGHHGRPPRWCGGLASADLGAEPMEWTRLAPVGPSPGARREPALIVDPVRHRLLLYGGRDSSGADLDDLWAFALDGSNAWTRLLPAGAAPVARSGAMMWMDPLEDRVVIAGGTQAGAPLADAWALAPGGTPAWTPLGVQGRAPSTPLRAWTRDVEHDRAIAFTAGAAESVWVFDRVAADGFAWRLATASGPVPAPLDARTPAVFDPFRGRAMLLFGERVPDYSLGYELDLAAHWTVRIQNDAAADTPPARVPALALGPARPDPADGSFRLRVAVPDARAATLDVFDTAGRRVHTRTVTGPGAHEVEVPTASLRPGVYLVRVAHASATRFTRVTVVR